jgi:FHA domain-containing protein
MAPPGPKRPSRQRGAGQAPGRKKPDVELPFDDVEDLTPLRADDPRPQRVPEIPSGMPRRRGAGDAVLPGARGMEVEDGFQPAFLYVERGPGMGQLSPVRQGVTLIGRASTAGLRLQHPSISRKHAEISRRAERFFIKDLGSQNGTYVNGVRIEKETELFAGDEIVVGTAQLRLRAQGAQTGGQAGQRQQQVDSGRASAEKPAPRKGGSMAFVAVAAGIVGSGLAAVGMFIFFKVSKGPSFEELPHTANPPAASAPATPPSATPPPIGATTAPTTPTPTPPATATAPVTPPPSTPPPATPPPSTNSVAAAPLTPPSTGPATAASPPGLPTAPAPPPNITVGDPPKTDEGTDSSLTTTPAPPPRKPAKKPDRLASAAPPSKGDLENPPRDNPAAAPPADPTVMARYENGDAAAAVELARKKNEKELAAKLTRFQTLYESGMRALSSKDEGAALRNLDAALKLDEQFSGGWGKYNAELRRTLSSLYTMTGNRLAGDGNDAAAWKAYTSALQYDPDNATAKAQLSKLPPSAAPAPAPKAPNSRRADIDAAFGK